MDSGWVGGKDILDRVDRRENSVVVEQGFP